MKIINITFVTDKNYYEPTTVVMLNILALLKEDYVVCFYVIDVDYNESRNFENYYSDLFLIKNSEKCEVKIIDFSKDKVSDFTSRYHISVAAYVKVFLTELLPVEKTIYLDSDIVVREDIASLWNLFKDNYALQAVVNPFYNYDNKVMGLSVNDKTFNSGVMLLNLKMMRELQSYEKMLEFVKNNHDKTRLHDQAAFNAVFKNIWGELNWSWNMQRIMFLHTYRELGVNKNEYCEMLKNPKIVHFTSKVKPWMFKCSQPYTKKYLEYHNKLFGNITYGKKKYK